MSAKIDEKQVEGTGGMKRQGQIQEIRLAGSVAMQKEDRPLGISLGKVPPGDGDLVPGDQPNLSKIQAVSRGGNLRAVPRLGNRARGTEYPPEDQEANNPKESAEGVYKLSLMLPNQRE